MNLNNRIHAINSIAANIPEAPLASLPADTSIETYGDDVFGEKQIRQYLPKATAAKLLATVNDGKPLDPSIADNVARAMKEWALAKGATHFTHWFQPLTGGTAEKHDAFLEPTGPAQAVQKFSGKNLIGGETDASSFPSGGLRSTFEARGYTAWDVTSPAYLMERPAGMVLCIPTVFLSWTGIALDKKTPILRSNQALNQQAARVLRIFGVDPKLPIASNGGLEQEYFLIDGSFVSVRPDLLIAGRALYGATPAKGQEFDDQYYGVIPSRVLAFMADVERQLYRLGVPAKTRHNEVAPSQYEIAPTFETGNLATDHNQLIMTVLRKTARRHGMSCLLHEKPFGCINGSGKHLNYSIGSPEVGNLFAPGENPHENAQFLVFLCAVIRALHRHAGFLRAVVSSASNDRRLGANEAPPAIMSLFLGDQLTDILEQFRSGVEVTGTAGKRLMNVGVDTLPPLPKDATDRNRTSPFAFTGNKFEFRAPGSSQNCAKSQMVLNTIVAESIDALCDKLDAMKGDFNENLQKLLRIQVRSHKRVIFSGDGYSDDWPKEAKRRGLPNLRDTMESLAPLKDERNIALFEKYGVLSRGEMLSRYEIGRADYERRIRIEAGIALEIARSMIRPVVADEFSRLATALGQAKSDGLKVGIRGLTALSLKLGAGLDDLHVKCDRLEKSLVHGGHAEQIAAMNDLRKTVDRLEGLVDDARWPLPKYREMLFVY